MIGELMRQVDRLQRQIDGLVKPEIGGKIVAIVQDQKASGTDGGTFTSGAWQTRTLNTTVYSNLAGYSLAANQITLPAGSYAVFASAPSYRVNNNALRFYNTDDTVVEINGQSSYSAATYNEQAVAILSGKFSITATKTFELQHRCSNTQATNGFGANVGSAFAVGVEIYAEVRIWKL